MQLFKSLAILAVLTFATPVFSLQAEAAPKAKICKSKKTGKVVKCPKKSKTQQQQQKQKEPEIIGNTSGYLM